MSDEQKFCRYCKHMEFNSMEEYICTRGDAIERDLLSGHIIATSLCSFERSQHGKCGVDGKFYEKVSYAGFTVFVIVIVLALVGLMYVG